MYSDALTCGAKSGPTCAPSHTQEQADEYASKLQFLQKQDKLAHFQYQAALIQALTSGDDKTVNSLADQYKTYNSVLYKHAVVASDTM